VASGATVVVGSGLAARQLEPYLERVAETERGAAWVSPPIQTYLSWTTALWEKTVTDSRQLLTVGQSESLWRRVIGNSTAGERLLNSSNASRWAADAWATLWDWQVDPLKLRGNEEDIDFRSFLGWAHDYRDVLTDNGWIDSTLAAIELIGAYGLGADSNQTMVWADMPELTPAQAALYQRLESAGWSMESWQPPDVSSRCVRLALRDWANELSTAAHWAAEILEQQPEQRLTLVIPNLQTRRGEVRRALEDVLNPESVLLGGPAKSCYYNPNGEAVDLWPVIGAAMTALELVSTRGTFQTFSRWLRSPYFIDDLGKLSERATIEASLRTQLSAQLQFRQAFQGGSFAKRLRETAPEIATVLSLTLRMIDSGPRHATPTYWIKFWKQILTQLGWQPEVPTAIGNALPLWENALNSLALLTPIVGSISMTEALDELDRILRFPRTGGPIPLGGISVLERVEDVGPGYDAVWISGMTDNYWPRPALANPLLPLRLQRAHNMPNSSPRNTLELYRRATQRVIKRVPEIIFSWPGRVHEYQSEPSPLLADIADVTLERLVKSATPRLAVRLSRNRTFETVEDKAPALEGQDIAGGANTLDTQAKCPLRAFIERRLDAQPLETVTLGLGARQRGITTHRALELFLSKLPNQRELSAWQRDARQEWAADCAKQALLETFGSTRSALPILYRLEYERLIRITTSLLENDLKRQPFSVISVEERQDVEIKSYRLACRLDRIDSLAGGGVAVIDYKTGSSLRPSDWLKSRLLDTQLPLYAQTVGNTVIATVIAAVHADGVRFRGIWKPKGQFPGRVSKLPNDHDWTTQLELWREQIEALVIEFAGGDTRIFTNDLKAAGGPFAPLTRVIEQLALSQSLIYPGEAE